MNAVRIAKVASVGFTRDLIAMVSMCETDPSYSRLSPCSYAQLSGELVATLLEDLGCLEHLPHVPIDALGRRGSSSPRPDEDMTNVLLPHMPHVRLASRPTADAALAAATASAAAAAAKRRRKGGRSAKDGEAADEGLGGWEWLLQGGKGRETFRAYYTASRFGGARGDSLPWVGTSRLLPEKLVAIEWSEVGKDLGAQAAAARKTTSVGVMTARMVAEMQLEQQRQLVRSRQQQQQQQ
jgi:hypothetical protein